MESNNIMVSIIMLTYNHENFIPDAIEGVLLQKTNFTTELIVANDCSTDNTELIINQYRKKHPDLVKGYCNNKNIGSRRNFIKAYGFAKGKYIAMCEGDDYWNDPFKLQQQVDFLECNKEYVLSFHDIDVVDKDKNLIPGSNLPENDKRDYELNEMLGVYIPPPATVYRNVLKKLPIYFKKIDNADTLILALLTPYGKAKYIDSISKSCVRRHPGGIWTSKSFFERWSATLKLRYFIFKIMDKKLRPGMYQRFALMFNKASQDAIEQNAQLYWYKFNFRFVQLCIAAGMYGRAYFLGKRIIKRYLGFKSWLPDYSN